MQPTSSSMVMFWLCERALWQIDFAKHNSDDDDDVLFPMCVLLYNTILLCQSAEGRTHQINSHTPKYMRVACDLFNTAARAFAREKHRDDHDVMLCMCVEMPPTMLMTRALARWWSRWRFVLCVSLRANNALSIGSNFRKQIVHKGIRTKNILYSTVLVDGFPTKNTRTTWRL